MTIEEDMNNYDKTVRLIRDRRRAETDEAHIKWQEYLRADDALYAAFTAYQAEMIEAARGGSNKLSAARAALSAQMRRMNIDKRDFEPPPHCKICNDTGYKDGKYCKCVIRAVINADKENLTLPSVDFEKAAETAPKSIAKVYAAAKNYIDAFPDGDKPFMTVIGVSGTGKTVLAAAIATELMQKGAAAVTVTAFDFVRRALDYHKQFAVENYIDRFTPMLDCDVLAIDDLGKETMLKNVTLEYLYAVVNERWLHKKYTVFTSNLTPTQLQDRYGSAITSRMLDKNLALCFAVSGKNERV